jgi:hypothetical protein
MPPAGPLCVGLLHWGIYAHEVALYADLVFFQIGATGGGVNDSE